MSSNGFTKAIKGLWEKKASQPQGSTALGYNVQSQIDDVFLVLALLGEALLPLGIFDENGYHSTLTEVKSSIAGAGNVVLEDVFNTSSAELKILYTAALTVCAVFSPLPVYRGFGASVHSDWDWACPDFDYLEKKAKKATSMFSKTPDPQPNRPVLLAFDRAIQLLQVKSMAFLVRRPSISGFSEQQPKFGVTSVNPGQLHTCRDWKRYIHKHGHPSPSGIKVSSWAMPWATWTSNFNCELTSDFEQVLSQQMDPGRLLHAFLCRGTLNIHDGELLALIPGSSAEALASWLADCAGMSHKVIKWDQFAMPNEGKVRLLDRKVLRHAGRYPLPNQFVIRNPDVSKSGVTARTMPFSLLTKVRAQNGGRSPPPYSLGSEHVIAELGERDPAELDSVQRVDIPPESSATNSPNSPVGPRSAFVTLPHEMPPKEPRHTSALTQLSSPLSPSTESQSLEPQYEEINDTSAMPAPLRILSPHRFVAELPAEPAQAQRSSTWGSGSSLSPGAQTSQSTVFVSPISPFSSQKGYTDTLGSGPIQPNSPWESNGDFTTEPREVDSDGASRPADSSHSP